jgi:hypothetical protein
MAKDPIHPTSDAGGASRRAWGRKWLFGAGLAVVVIIAVAIFALAGGEGSDGGPLNAIAKAAEVTQREPGGRDVFRVTITTPESSEGLTETGSMIFDENERTEGTIDMSGLGLAHEAKILSVTDGLKTYMSSDLFDSLPEGKKWVELDLSSAVKTAPGSSVPTAPGPTEGLKTLEKVIGAKEIGKEAIEGVPTTHFSGTLPTAEEVFGVKPDISESHVDVWIDGQDRVRKMHLLITGGLAGGPAATTDMTIDFVEFGREPTISIPSQDEVFDATSKVEAAMQAASE